MIHRQKQLAPPDPKMVLRNLNDFPPDGYFYREPSLNWETTAEMAMGGLNHVARMLQIVRAQNPEAGLNPSLSVCVEDVKNYTCRRLNYDPRWCGLMPDEIQSQALLRQAGKRSRKVQGCPTCGRRR